MISTRLFLISSTLYLLWATAGSAQVKLAEVSGKPGSLDISSGLVFEASGHTGFLSNPGSGSIQRFKTGTGEILNSISLPPGVGPICLSFNGRRLVALGVTTQRIYVIDVSDQDRMTLSREMGYQPSGFTYRSNIVLSRDGAFAYIADPLRDHIAVFNTSDGVLDRFIRVDKNPAILTLLPNGEHIAALCSGKRDTDTESVWIVDTLSIRVIDNPVFGSARTEPFNNIQATVDGAHLFVGSYNDNRILTYDQKSKIPGSRSSFGTGPAKIVSSANGRWLVVVNVTSQNLALLGLPELNKVEVLEFPNLELSTETLPAFSADSHTLYIPSAGTKEIIAYDVENLRVRKRIPTGMSAARLSVNTDGSIMASLEPGSNAVSLIAVTPTPFYLPHLVQDADDYSGIALANFAGESANVALVAKSNTGELLPGSSNPRLVTLPPNRQLSMVAAQIFGFNPNDTLEGYIEAYALASNVSLLYLTGKIDQSELDGFVADSEVGKLLAFCRVDEGVSKFGTPTSTEIILQNPNESEASVSYRMFGKTIEGPAELIASRTAKLPAHARTRSPISLLLPTGHYPIDQAYVEVTSDLPLKGIEVVRMGESMAIIPAAIRGRADVEFEAVQFASGGAGSLDTPIFSHLALSNAASDPMTVTAEVTDRDGNIVPELGEPTQVTLQPYETVVGGADVLLSFPDPLTDPALYQGTLHISADAKGLVPSLVYGDARNGKYLAAAGLKAQRGTRFGLAHFAEGLFGDPPKGLYTGIAIYNPTRNIAYITVEPFTPDGVSIGKTTLAVERGSRISRTIGELIPGLQQQNGGTVLITSDREITLFEVFGSSTSEFLVSVTPLVLQ